MRHSWRPEALSRLDETFDLVILGGGITGCGVLMEAAQRGLSVLLLEKGDLASGTSSRSSKLLHGGLRYLKQGKLHLTRLSCRERDRYLRLNPELARPLRFLYPVRHGDPVPAWALGLGLWLYDRFATRTGGRDGVGDPTHRRLDRDQARELAPDLAVEEGETTFTYGDGLADDARLTLAVAATGIAAGGRLLLRAEALEMPRDARGRISGVVFRDLETGQSHTARARLVVNAAGVWVDRLRERAGLSGRRLRPSRGSHLVFRPDRLPLEAAVAAPSPDDGRPVFLIPHPEGVLAGTTDLFHQGSLDDPRPTAEETDYLLRAAQSLFPERHLDHGDVVGAFAGLRPILDDRATDPSKASRDEAIWEEEGMLSVTGGKLTTWRVMAEEAVDEALRHLAKHRDGERAASARPTVSAGTPLVGRAPEDLPDRLAALWPSSVGAPREVARAAARRLRGMAPWLPRLAHDESEMHPLLDGGDLCAAEVRAHLAFGAVLRLEDLLLRRVRVGVWDPPRARELVPRLRTFFQQELAWDTARWETEEERCAEALEGWRPPYNQTTTTNPQ